MLSTHANYIKNIKILAFISFKKKKLEKKMDYKLNVGLGYIPGHKKPKFEILVFVLFSRRVCKIRNFKNQNHHNINRNIYVYIYMYYQKSVINYQLLETDNIVFICIMNLV